LSQSLILEAGGKNSSPIPGNLISTGQSRHQGSYMYTCMDGHKSSMYKVRQKVT